MPDILTDASKGVGVPWGTALARPGQPLSVHSANVSALAGLFGGKCGASELLRTAGFIHDLGKVSAVFQEYITRIAAGETGLPSPVQHSIYGAKRLYQEIAGKPAAAAVPEDRRTTNAAADQLACAVAELLANAAAAHHGSLYDYLTPDGETPLTDKLAAVPDYAGYKDILTVNCDTLYKEFADIMARLPAEKTGRGFGLSMLAKYVYSCLVDADRLDAYLHAGGKTYAPEKTDWDTFLTKLADRLDRLAPDRSPSAMTELRRGISDACAAAGQGPQGIYKLEAPTGGGKTLSSLRFALEQARLHQLDRIIYVIPYLSILSQTAQEIRLALAAGEHTVLEHHSGFLPDEPENYKLHTDRWDAPVILTTQVQFLESLFSAKGSDLRKLHNMARSIIIFDEVQSLPLKCIHLFNGAVNFLYQVCGSTVLLCTATQPLLDTTERPVAAPVTAIAGCGSAPERYRIVNSLRAEGYSYPALAEFVLARHTRSTLVIVNTKAAAKSLYEELKSAKAPVLHLSTNMCPLHRDAVIAELRRRLDPDILEPVICVSTQLIEAGVDISFACVVRSNAGLDSIWQAAGRCNRHGEFGEVQNVYVVNPAAENLDRLVDIKTGAEITARLFAENNLDITQYYQYYFYARRNMMDYPLKDSGSLYDLLSLNKTGRNAYGSRKDKQGVRPPALTAALQSAAEEFFVIERGRTEVIVPYGNSAELLSQFLVTDDVRQKRSLLRRLEKYSVSLYQYQVRELKRCRAIDDINYGGLNVLERGFYDEERGVDLEGSPEFLHV